MFYNECMYNQNYSTFTTQFAEENVPTILGADEDALCSEADNNEAVHNYVMQSDDEVYLDIGKSYLYM